MYMRKTVYTKVDPATVKENRRFFKRKVKVAFVKWCAYQGHLDEVLSKYELKLAKNKGYLPEDLDIHHILPLSGTEYTNVNSFSNLCVLHKRTHQRINKEIFQPQLKGMCKLPYGTMRVIEVPIFDPVDTKNILQERKKVLDKSEKRDIILTKEGGR